MIKLIVTDIDGTLVNSKKELPEETYSLVNELHDRGIRFCAASGRQYYNLIDLFEPVKDKITFIADNGSIVFNNGENIIADELNHDDLKYIYNILSGIEDIAFVFCGLNYGYIIENDSRNFKDIASRYYARLKEVPNLLDTITQDKICKIAIFDFKNAEENSYIKVKPHLPNHQVTLASHEWVDIMNSYTNKGNGVRTIQNIYNISKDETMVFGDYLNDYEMMFEATHSYAMSNAHPKLKEVAKNVAPSNDEKGVIKVISDYLKNLD